MIKTCKICGKEFKTNVSHQAYCCTECRKAARSMQRLNRIQDFREQHTPIAGKSVYEWCMENGEYGQKILSEYSIQNYLSPQQVKAGGNRSLIWKCSECGQEWEATPMQRLGNGIPCPECTRKFMQCNMTVYEFCQQKGEFGQKILKEFSYKNFESPHQIKAGSNIRNVIWKCSECGHEWKESPYFRLMKGTGCPECAKKGK